MLFVQTYQITTCPQCKGQGKQIEKPCKDCRGDGLTRVKKEFDLKVPAGIEDGSRMRLTGAGDKGQRGGPFGDLFVIIHVKQHKEFLRDGTTIHLKKEISFSMAALGGELLVPTVDGSKILKIPDGIQNGAQLVMRDLGVPYLNNASRRGDQIVHVVIKTPTSLSKREKELFNELAELKGEKLSIEEEDLPEPETTDETKSEKSKSNGKKKKKDFKHKQEDESLLDKIVDAFRPKSAE